MQQHNANQYLQAMNATSCDSSKITTSNLRYNVGTGGKNVVVPAKLSLWVVQALND